MDELEVVSIGGSGLASRVFGHPERSTLERSTEAT
jgi:hypothetical protein